MSNIQTSYSKNYIKIYSFQIVSIILGFISLFVVVPYLSSDKATYGIYTVCISISVFLSYADLGFLGAGMKYAAESFSKNDRKTEIKLVGFSHFILLIFILLFAICAVVLSINPRWLIGGDLTAIQVFIANRLLLILAISSPIVVLQRALQMIFGIRLQGYVLQRINIFGNLVKISSVFYFFEYNHYDIIGYFLFVQIVNFLCAIFGGYLLKKKYEYDFIQLLKSFKFNREIYNKTKKLAFSGLFVTISFVLYYELDSFVIGRFLGASEVAIFAIGFTILTFFRSLFGVFFSPFSARFNHFIGTDKLLELKKFYLHVIQIATPIAIFPVFALVFFARPIVISWVGSDYEQSVIILQILVFCNIFAFYSYPAGMLVAAQEKFKIMYFLAISLPIFYWVGVFLSIHSLGLVSFAICKLIAFSVSGIVYLHYTLKFLNISFASFLNTTILPCLPGLIVMCSCFLFCNTFFIDGKNKLFLLINGGCITLGVIVAIGVSLLFSKPLYLYGVKMFNLFCKNEI